MIVAVMHRYPSTYKRNLPVTLLVTFPILHTKPQCWILQAKIQAIEKCPEESLSEFIEKRPSNQDGIMTNAPTPARLLYSKAVILQHFGTEENSPGRC
jgi:hypothetical protein